MATKSVKVRFEKGGEDSEGILVLRKMSIGELKDYQSWVAAGGKDPDMELIRRSIREAPFGKDEAATLDPDSYADLLTEITEWYGPFFERMLRASDSFGKPSSDEPTKQASQPGAT